MSWLGELGWLDPWFFGLIAVAALAVAWRLRRPRAALPVASIVGLDELPRSLRSRLVQLPLVLMSLGVVALSVALARPVSREVLPLREAGVDILLLVDISGSMEQPDMDDRGTRRRIEAAREQAIEFAKARPDDRIGLMTFALYPELRCPLTLDKEALQAFLRAVETAPRDSEESRATAIGVGLARAVTFLEDSEARSKVVVLLTDGENNVPDVMPEDAAKLAKDAEVRVHTIGIGRDRVMRSFLGDQRVRTDFSAIQKIAEITGGRFFRAEGEDDLHEVYTEIDKMEKVELEDPRYRTSDWFAWPLLAGAALLALALLAELALIRGAP